MNNYLKKYFQIFFKIKILLYQRLLSVAGELDNTTLSKLENSKYI